MKSAVAAEKSGKNPLNIYGVRDVIFNEKALRRLKRIDDTPLAKRFRIKLISGIVEKRDYALLKNR